MSIKNFFNTQISREFISLFTGYVNFFNQFKAIYDPFLRDKHKSHQHRMSGGLDNVYGLILSHKLHDLQFRYRFSQKQKS